MESGNRNLLVVAGGVIAGALAGRWLTPKVGAALGMVFAPWSTAVGAVIGAVVIGALVSSLSGGEEEVS